MLNQKFMFILGALCVLALVVGIVSLNSNELVDAPEGNTNPEVPSESENFEPETPSENQTSSSGVVSVMLNSNSISAENTPRVVVDGTTLTIVSAGDYRISGVLDDGQIIVDTNDNETVTLVLDGVQISSSVSAPVFVEDAKKTVIVLADGSENILTDASNNPDNASLCSRADLVIRGNGALTVTGNSNDGIRSNDGLVIEGGVITVNSVDDGLRGKDYLEIKGGIISVTSVGDGLISDNDADPNMGYVSVTGGDITVVSTGGDAISAQTDLTVTGGTFQLTSGGGSSASLDVNVSTKGLKSGTNLVVEDGNFVISSSDDAVHSDGSVALNGGIFELSSGDDGIRAIDSITLESVTVDLKKSYEGMEAPEIGINNSDVSVNSKEDGISGTDFLVISDCDLSVVSVGDGLKSDSTEGPNKGYITIEDSTIEVTSSQGDAVTAQTDLLITSGTFDLTSGGGANVVPNDNLSTKGLKAGVNLVIEDGDFNISSSDDAIHSNDAIVINKGTFAVATGDDGIHADNSVEINGGIIDVSQSFEGLESGLVTINDGHITINSSDDAINIADPNESAQEGGGFPWGGWGGGGMAVAEDCYLIINGGTVFIESGGDGIDSNGHVIMTGGLVVVQGPSANMNAAIDYGFGTFNMTGGTLVAVGSSFMAQGPSGFSSQRSLSVSFDAPQQGNTLVNIQTALGETILTVKPTKGYQSVVFSSPDLEAGTYDVYLGGSSTGTSTFGLIEGGTYSGGTKVGTVTVS